VIGFIGLYGYLIYLLCFHILGYAIFWKWFILWEGFVICVIVLWVVLCTFIGLLGRLRWDSCFMLGATCIFTGLKAVFGSDLGWKLITWVCWIWVCLRIFVYFEEGCCYDLFLNMERESLHVFWTEGMRDWFYGRVALIKFWFWFFC